MRLIFSPRAEQDLQSIYNHSYELSPSSAEKVMSAIQASIHRLKDFPHLAPESIVSRVRVQLVRRYKFQIFYRIESDTIGIVHIRHTAREPFTPET